MKSEHKDSKVISDNPIEKLDDDLWDREKSVNQFVQYVLNIDCSKGLVVGIFAPWGNGKTSFFNLAKSKFIEMDINVVDFNPWMFGDSGQLARRFFREISSGIKSTTGMEEIGKWMKKYGHFVTVAGGVAVTFFGYVTIGDLLSKLFRNKSKSSDSVTSTIKLRKSVEDALNKSNKPIIAVLDDVDRLSTQEIKEVFKLVRLTANFPNLIYILLFDRERVEKALQDDGITGRDYLEKIIQLPYNLPMPPRDAINDQLQHEINLSVQMMGHEEKLDPKIMTDIFAEIIFPLVRNMRDIRRYVLAVRETIGALSERISAADLLALEAVRLFRPDLFALLPELIDDLTIAPASRSNVSNLIEQISKEQKEKTRLKRINGRLEELFQPDSRLYQLADSFVFRVFINPFNESGENSEIDSNFLHRLLHDRRVAHRQIFCCYLERADNPEIRDYYLAKRAIELVNNSANFEEFLLSLTEDRRLGLVSHLSQFTNSIHSDKVVFCIVSTLNLSQKLIFESIYGLHELTSNINRFIRNLLEMYAADVSPDIRSTKFETLFSEITHSVSPISSQFKLLKQIEIVSESQMGTQHRQVIYQNVLNASPDLLVREYNLKDLYLFANEVNEGQIDAEPLVINKSPAITFAILFSARTIQRHGSVNSSYFNTEIVFALDELIDLFGNREELKQRVLTMVENSELVLREFESLGLKSATVQTILNDAQMMASNI